MVKMLVENGACIYAITLSDAETPAKKCEENEDGYVSCANYLDLADKWAGIINNKIVSIKIKPNNLNINFTLFKFSSGSKFYIFI
jgi:hypothetical protein